MQAVGGVAGVPRCEAMQTVGFADCAGGIGPKKTQPNLVGTARREELEVSSSVQRK